MESDSQTRKYQLTINNPADHGYDHDVIKDILMSMRGISYFCIGDEVGNETKTKHTHVFLYSHSPIRFSTLKNRFPSAHIERARGSCIANRNYILKGEKWENSDKANTVVQGSFEEIGVLPSERAEKEPDMSQIVSMFDDGYSINDVIDSFPKYALRTVELENLYSIRNIKKAATRRSLSIVYLFGDTGVGKTYSIYNKYDPNEICRITNYSTRGLFDSYNGQSVLMFDEFHSQIPLPEMLTYLDVYPVSLPARYHNRQALYTKVYIVSNIPISEQYKEARLKDKKTWLAF